MFTVRCAPPCGRGALIDVRTAQDAALYEALDAVRMRERVENLATIVTEGGDNFRCAALLLRARGSVC